MISLQVSMLSPLWTKRLWTKRSLVAFLLALLAVGTWLPQQLQGQSADSPWTTYKLEDGLASNNVVKILALDGEIWFGTDNGVSRFTGEWTSWRPENDFVPGIVQGLVKDEVSGALYAGTSRGYIVRWDGESWQSVVQMAYPVQALLVVDGQLWIGTGAGLFTWMGSEAVPVDALQGRSIQSLAGQPNGAVWAGTPVGLWLYQRQSWTHLVTEDGLPGNNVTAIWVDPNGPVYVGTTEGLVKQDPITGNWVPITLENAQGKDFSIRALTGNSIGEIWGGADGDGAFLITEDEFTVSFSGDIGLTTRFVQAVAIDADNSVWFGTAAGIFRYDPKAWVKELREFARFPGINSVNALLIDDANRVWIGTAGGIRLKEDGARPFLQEVTFVGSDRAPDEAGPEALGGLDPDVAYVLPDSYVMALVQDQDRNIWAGTWEGLIRYNPDSGAWDQPIDSTELPSEIINVLLADGDVLWIGTPSGLARYHMASGELSTVEAIAATNIQALALDTRGRLWVGTLRRGLYIAAGEDSWEHVQARSAQRDGISGNSVVGLATDASGGMWIAIQRHGLNYWDGRQWLDYAGLIELPSNLIYTLYPDPINGSLWVGSEGGVTRYDGRTWETLNVGGTFPGASIYAISHTRDGSYWFGGKDGLTFYHPEETPPWIRIDTLSGTHTQLADGTVKIETGNQIGIRFVAGDLHTTPSNLETLYRLSGPGRVGEWQPANGEFLELPVFEEEGAYVVELMARDLAFNYSEPTRLNLQVVPPPATVQLPFIGAVAVESLLAFSVIGAIATISLIYMSVGIVQGRRRTREAISRGYNPFVSGEPVRRADMFFGRQELLQRIIDTLHNNSIMIHGERRIGKTTLLYQLSAYLRQVDDPEYWFIPLYIDLEGTAEESFFHFLMEEVLHGIAELPDAQERLLPSFETLLFYQEPAAEYTDRQFSRDLREVINTLQIYGEGSYPNKKLRLILLLDEMDVLSDYSRLVQQRLRRIFMRDFAASLGAVVAGIRISKEWDRIESPWYNLFNEIELGPFSREQAIELLTAPVRDYYSYEPAALDFIVEQSEGRPFRIQQYALEAINHMLAEGRRVITADDVRYAHEHIQSMGNDNTVGLDGIPTGQNGMAAVEDSEPSTERSGGEPFAD